MHVKKGITDRRLAQKIINANSRLIILLDLGGYSCLWLRPIAYPMLKHVIAKLMTAIKSSMFIRITPLVHISV